MPRRRPLPFKRLTGAPLRHPAAVLLGMTATNVHAAVTGFDLSALTGVICGISTFVSGPFLFAGGLIIIVLAAIAIANSESTIMKFVSVAGVGIGLAAAATPILQRFGITNGC